VTAVEATDAAATGVVVRGCVAAAGGAGGEGAGAASGIERHGAVSVTEGIATAAGGGGAAAGASGTMRHGGRGATPPSGDDCCRGAFAARGATP
jgi:hypothetical protein